MQDIRLKYLFNQCFQNQATPEEQEEFQAFVADLSNKSQVEQAMENYWNDFEPKGKPFSVTERDMMWYNIVTEKPARSYRLWPRIIGVAAAVALIVLGIYFFSAPRHPELVSGSPLANDIGPGKNTATLTLPNGKTIELSDAKTGVVVGNELKYNDGSTVAALSASGGEMPEGQRGGIQTLTASTPRGGTYQVILPDGTKVWLNADSKISFPVQFSGGIRKILLSGEGYFEVAKDKRHPFVVQTDKQEVTVLGTHFNINAYSDESSTKTTLLEGSVRISPLSAMGRDVASRQRGERGNNNNPLSPQGGSLPGVERSIVLKPNQQSVVTGYDRIAVADVNANEAVAWKMGLFSFKSEEVGSIMRKISRWYNVDIIYNDDANTIIVSGEVPRFANLSALLSKLQKTGLVNFKVEGKMVYVSKGK